VNAKWFYCLLCLISDRTFLLSPLEVLHETKVCAWHNLSFYMPGTVESRSSLEVKSSVSPRLATRPVSGTVHVKPCG